MTNLPLNISINISNTAINNSIPNCTEVEHTLDPLCRPEDLQAFYLVRVIVVGFVILLTFLVNSSLLYVLMRVREGKAIRDDGCGYYIINLCIIDLIASVICSVCTALYRLSETCDEFRRFWITSSSLQILSSTGSILFFIIELNGTSTS